MPGKIEDLIARMEDAGVDPDFIQETKDVFDASPLRAEVKAKTAEVNAAVERAQKAEASLLGSTFKELGIPGKPGSYRLPDDLDVTDRDAIQSWAIDNEFVPKPEAIVPTDQLDALDRVQTAAAAGGNNPDPLATLLAGNLSRDEFYAQAKAAGAAT